MWKSNCILSMYPRQLINYNTNNNIHNMYSWMWRKFELYFPLPNRRCCLFTFMMRIYRKWKEIGSFTSLSEEWGKGINSHVIINLSVLVIWGYVKINHPNAEKIVLVLQSKLIMLYNMILQFTSINSISFSNLF